MPVHLCLGCLLLVLAMPASALSAGDTHELRVPTLLVGPFVLLLLSIALLPVLAGHWWEHNRNRLVVSLLFAVPVAAYLLFVPHGGGEHLLHALEEYVAFICLLGSLYTISGGIVIGGAMRGRPINNVAILGFGTVLANFIGTTGASMLLIRPILRINQTRQRRMHIPLFFIFTVSNLGGLLTPLGDPPLFLGLLRGVPFFWTLQLLPQWLLANGIVLSLFFIWDSIAYMREPPPEGPEDYPSGEPLLHVRGVVNFALLGGVVGVVLLQSPDVSGQLVDATGGLLPPDAARTSGGGLSSLWGAALMAGLGLTSYLITPLRLRHENRFSWGPILEVAVLFLGIFVTMVPALAVLREMAPRLGLDEPWQYFVLSGTLSSFLDNAPTYVAFGNMAAGADNFALLVNNQVAGIPGPIVLAAISCGAVFMGANTYIGNGPNFMVKAISDEVGYRMPSFFGYFFWAVLVLGPVFFAIIFVFFTPAAWG